MVEISIRIFSIVLVFPTYYYFMRLVSAMLTVEVFHLFPRGDAVHYWAERGVESGTIHTPPLSYNNQATTVDIRNPNARTAYHKAMSTWVLGGRAVQIAVHQGCCPSVF